MIAAGAAAVVIVDHLETLSGVDIPIQYIQRYDYAYLSGGPLFFLPLFFLRFEFT